VIRNPIGNESEPVFDDFAFQLLEYLLSVFLIIPYFFKLIGGGNVREIGKAPNFLGESGDFILFQNVFFLEEIRLITAIGLLYNGHHYLARHIPAQDKSIEVVHSGGVEEFPPHCF